MPARVRACLPAFPSLTLPHPSPPPPPCPLPLLPSPSLPLPPPPPLPLSHTSSRQVPDCSAAGRETELRVTCTNAIPGLRLRLVGDSFPRDLVLESRDLVIEEDSSASVQSGPDVGTFSIR